MLSKIRGGVGRSLGGLVAFAGFGGQRTKHNPGRVGGGGGAQPWGWAFQALGCALNMYTLGLD